MMLYYEIFLFCFVLIVYLYELAESDLVVCNDVMAEILLLDL